ncbi:hypothetical protein VNO78_18259 [Psophocarpus tetragonolobus]|uniref:Uncharacterized protein n=1 Tax=Psophocarpus tetragonolobus TaxID=3891 RepID=A0AAN9XLC0_PSOTE
MGRGECKHHYERQHPNYVGTLLPPIICNVALKEVAQVDLSVVSNLCSPLGDVLLHLGKLLNFVDGIKVSLSCEIDVVGVVG